MNTNTPDDGEYIPQTGPVIINTDTLIPYTRIPKVEKEVTDADRREFLRNPDAPQAVAHS